MLAGLVLARASAELADGTTRGGVGHLDQMRAWFGRPRWDMEPVDADGYFGKVPRGSPSGTRLARAQALSRHFLFLELRHKVEIHRMTGRVVTEALVRVLAGRARTIGVASPGEIFDAPDFPRALAQHVTLDLPRPRGNS